MAFTKRLHTTWFGIPADSADPVAHWLNLVSQTTKSLWMPKCHEFHDAGRMADLYALEITPQIWERLFIDQAAVDEWCNWVAARTSADGVTIEFQVSDI